MTFRGALSGVDQALPLRWKPTDEFTVGQCPSQIESAASQIECEALVDFYLQSNGVDWIRVPDSGPPPLDFALTETTETVDLGAWGTTTDPCTWYGVTCSADGVIELVLGSSAQPGVQGVLSPKLGDMTNLEVLKLNTSYLTGPIPPQLGDITPLQVLDLIRCDLTGPIPADLGRLANLTALHLGNGGSLEGPIPAEFGDLAALQQLTVTSYASVGPIPPELGQLDQLDYLRLGPVEGSIPVELTTLPALRTISIFGLSGVIPPELGNLTALEYLSLDGDMPGPIPPSLGNLSTLRVIDLNWLNLTGTLPPELGGLTNLQEMYLNGNNLSGPIPSSYGGLTNLARLFLDENSLSGDITDVMNSLRANNLVNLGLRRNGCFTVTDPDLATWLGSKSSGWDANC